MKGEDDADGELEEKLIVTNWAGKAVVDVWCARESELDSLLLLGGLGIIPQGTLENPIDDGEELPAYPPTRAGARTPHHRDDALPRDGYGVLAEQVDGDEDVA